MYVYRAGLGLPILIVISWIILGAVLDYSGPWTEHDMCSISTLLGVRADQAGQKANNNNTS